MACGVPVISTNAGGLPEINIQGETGYLSNVGDIEDMARHALHILSDDVRLLEFKKRALAHAGTFDKDLIVPVYEKLYEEVVENYRARQLSIN